MGNCLHYKNGRKTCEPFYSARPQLSVALSPFLPQFGTRVELGAPHESGSPSGRHPFPTYAADGSCAATAAYCNQHTIVPLRNTASCDPKV
jgi:hypothetical protein